jgi:transposase
MSRRPSPTDLTDAEWLLVEPYVAPSGLGRPPKHAKRDLLNALFYQARAGGAG